MSTRPSVQTIQTERDASIPLLIFLLFASPIILFVLIGWELFTRLSLIVWLILVFASLLVAHLFSTNPSNSNSNSNNPTNRNNNNPTNTPK